VLWHRDLPSGYSRKDPGFKGSNTDGQQVEKEGRKTERKKERKKKKRGREK